MKSKGKSGFWLHSDTFKKQPQKLLHKISLTHIQLNSAVIKIVLFPPQKLFSIKLQKLGWIECLSRHNAITQKRKFSLESQKTLLTSYFLPLHVHPNYICCCNLSAVYCIWLYLYFKKNLWMNTYLFIFIIPSWSVHRKIRISLITAVHSHAYESMLCNNLGKNQRQGSHWEEKGLWGKLSFISLHM